MIVIVSSMVFADNRLSTFFSDCFGQSYSYLQPPLRILPQQSEASLFEALTYPRLQPRCTEHDGISKSVVMTHTECVVSISTTLLGSFVPRTRDDIQSIRALSSTSLKNEEMASIATTTIIGTLALGMAILRMEQKYCWPRKLILWIILIILVQR